MEKIRISDITMKQLAKGADHSLSFKGKLEIAKLLDRLGVSVIEVEGLGVDNAGEKLVLELRVVNTRLVNSVKQTCHNCKGF